MREGDHQTEHHRIARLAFDADEIGSDECLAVSRLQRMCHAEHKRCRQKQPGELAGKNHRFVPLVLLVVSRRYNASSTGAPALSVWWSSRPAALSERTTISNPAASGRPNLPSFMSMS